MIDGDGRGDMRGGERNFRQEPGRGDDVNIFLVNLSHDPLTVLQLTTPLPEGLAVFNHLLWRLTLHLSADVFHILPTILLVQPDELVEVSLAPVREAFLQKIFLFQLLIFSQLFCLVDLPLLFLLNPLGVCPKVRIERNFVSHRVPIVVDLLVQQLKKTSREELKVLNDRLLGWSWSLVCFGLVGSSPQRLPEVGVHCIIGFSLPLWWCDPVQPDVLSLVPEVLSFKRVHRFFLNIVDGESAKAALAKSCHFLILFCSSSLASLEKLVNVDVG